MINELGPDIADIGYLVCAIAPGKKYPMGKAWGEHPLTADECRNFKPSDAGVGIICGKGQIPVYGLDFDIPGDPNFAIEIRRAVAKRLRCDDLLYRVGQPPKFLVPVQGEPGLHKRTSRFFEKNGFRARLEVLGDGQQFVAEGVHPDVGERYQWFGTPALGNGRISASYMLPSITIDMVDDLITLFEEMAVAHGWVPFEGAKGRPLVRSDDESLDIALNPQYPVGLTIEQAKHYMQDLQGAEDYDTWLRVGMALHHEFGRTPSSDDALNLWAEWSSEAPNYKSFEDLRYRWNGFDQRTDRRAVTIRWIISEYKRTHHDKAAEMTEAGRAYRMAEYFNGRLKYATDSCTWYAWDGVHWRAQTDACIAAKAAFVLGDLLRSDIADSTLDRDQRASQFKFYDKCQTAARVSGVLGYAKSIESLWCKSSDFDSNPRYFGVANGDIDLHTGELLAPDPARMVSLASLIEYNPEAKCPLWEQTVLEIMNDDPTAVEYLQRIFGYSMCGDPREELMFIFYGSGNNGKSTILKAVRSVLGQHGCSLSPETLTSTGNSSNGTAGGARADLVALQGKRFAVIPETEERARLKEATVKRLVSIDEIAARGVYESNMRYFTPTWVPIMATNYLPRIDGTDDGIWRRVRPIGFNRNFDNDPKVRRDAGRSTRLRAELPGILAWMVRGALRYREIGMRAPESVRLETAGYRASMDALQEWMDERCALESGAVTSVNDAWASWKRYSESAGTERAIPTKTALTQRLYKKGIESKQVKVNGRNVRCYIGLRLIDEFA